jgi:hypothetical protein
MDSIELIEIRVAQKRCQEFESQIEDLIDELQKAEQEFTMNFYSHRQLKSDYLLLIFHTEEIPDQRGSAIGHRLAEAFREYGVINRSAWNAITTKYNIRPAAE